MNRRLPSLDGWRAISILLLLLGHSVYTAYFPAKLKAAGMQGIGIMGVRFFFVISGFLITWLLVRECTEAGGINLKNFYIRRILRIFPVVYIYLAVLGFFTVYHQAWSAWAANLTFTTNYIPVGFSTSHLWSLAVEEQFYLLWPLLLLLLRPSGKPVLFVLLVPMVMAPVIRSQSFQRWLPADVHNWFGYWSFFSEFDLLAYGCLAAILMARYRARLEAFFQSRPVIIPLVAAGVIVLSVIGHSRLGGLYETFQGIGFSTLLLQSVLMPQNIFFRPLQWAWMRWLGALSYSIYIWQMMFCGTEQAVFGVEHAWWTTFPAWLLMSLLAGSASYYLLERPLFALRGKFRSGDA